MEVDGFQASLSTFMVSFFTPILFTGLNSSQFPVAVACGRF